MFGTANRRAPSTPVTSPAMEAVEATRAPERQPLQRPADHPGPIVSERQSVVMTPELTPTPSVVADHPDEGRLTVGRDIRLSGELKSCESLIVEGVVNLDLQGTKYLEVLEGGTFAGSAMVDSAEIAGSFEGDLTVTGLLVIHPSGRINGNITTSELQLERGGMICGNLQMTGKPNDRASRLSAFSRRQDEDSHE